MADLVCPVCGTRNPSTRTFCLTCAADLHAPVPDATTVMATPRTEVPMRPILIGAGLALVVMVAVAILVVVAGSLGASPAPSSGTTAGTSTGPAATPGSTAAASTGPTAAPAPTAAPVATPTPKPTAAPATPVVTPVPPPTILSFKGPTTVDCTDPQFSGFIHLTWLVDHADSTTLSIDGPGLYKAYPGAQGEDDVPFGCGAGEHTYTLRTVGGNGAPASKTLTITEG